VCVRLTQCWWPSCGDRTATNNMASMSRRCASAMSFRRSTRLTGIAACFGGRLAVRRGAPASDHPCALSRPRVVGQAGEAAVSSSTTAASSPLRSNSAQIASMSASVIANIERAWRRAPPRASVMAHAHPGRAAEPGSGEVWRGPVACRRQIPTGTTAHRYRLGVRLSVVRSRRGFQALTSGD